MFLTELKLIDEIFQRLCSKMTTAEWVRPDELTEIIRRQGLTQRELEEIAGFIKKYFMNVDESNQRMKLNSWTYNLFESSTP